MRTAAAMIAMMLAATSVAPAADQTIDAKVSGKIEGTGAKVSGTITINVAPAAPEKTTGQDKNKIEQLQECGDKWNKELAAYNKARKNGQKPSWLWLTRLDYRTCMEQCLAGNVVTPLKCEADSEEPPQQKPAGGDG